METWAILEAFWAILVRLGLSGTRKEWEGGRGRSQAETGLRADGGGGEGYILMWSNDVCRHYFSYAKHALSNSCCVPTSASHHGRQSLQDVNHRNKPRNFHKCICLTGGFSFSFSVSEFHCRRVWPAAGE